eukprot:13067387-Alexandrium_andersonii.AAC.1
MASDLSCLVGHPEALLCAWDARVACSAGALERAVAHASPCGVVRASVELSAAVGGCPLPSPGGLAVLDIVRCHGLRLAESA